MVEFNGQEEVVNDTAMTMVMIGGGFTYYLGPSNTYLTASVGVLDAELRLRWGDPTIPIPASLSKWVWARSGGSATAGVSGSRGAPDITRFRRGDATGSFKGPSFAVRLSATFN